MLPRCGRAAHICGANKTVWELQQTSKRELEESQLPSKQKVEMMEQGFKGNCDSQGKLGMCPSLAEPDLGGISKSNSRRVSHETSHKIIYIERGRVSMAIGGLGSGLDFLFDENTAEVPVKRTLRLSEIEPNREQPRKTFSEEAISALADSIRQYGMLQPILVRPYGMTYQIVAGERRWRAANLLGLEEVPVIIKEFSDKETMQIALIENLVREDLTPLEEAAGFRDLMDQFDMTQEAVSKSIGRSRSAVANALRLLQLPQPLQELLECGKITAGHARALLAISDPDLQLETARRCAEDGMTVRAVEKLAAEQAAKAEKPAKKRKTTDQYYKEMELELTDRLQRKVSVTYGRKKGTLMLEFYNKEDLASLAKQLTELAEQEF